MKLKLLTAAAFGIAAGILVICAVKKKEQNKKDYECEKAEKDNDSAETDSFQPLIDESNSDFTDNELELKKEEMDSFRPIVGVDDSEQFIDNELELAKEEINSFMPVGGNDEDLEYQDNIIILGNDDEFDSFQPI